MADLLAASTPTTIDTRKQKLAEMINAKIEQGYRIESQGDTEAVLYTESRRHGSACLPEAATALGRSSRSTSKARRPHESSRVATRYPSKPSAQTEQRLYTLVPPPPIDADDPQRLPLTVRSDRDLCIGSQIWAQQECWELVESHAPLEDSPERVAFLRDTSPSAARPHPRRRTRELAVRTRPPRARQGGRGCPRGRDAGTRTIRAAIRAALDGGSGVQANLEGDALRILAQAIRGLEISSGLSPALRQLGGNLNHHFDDLRSAVQS